MGQDGKQIPRPIASKVKQTGNLYNENGWVYYWWECIEGKAVKECKRWVKSSKKR